MKNLIPLEQIVEQQLQIKQSSSEFKEAIKISVNALKQQPQLNHFIPCVEKDGEWVVMEEPIESKSYNFIFAYLKEQYQSASKNVLFDAKVDETVSTNDTIYILCGEAYFIYTKENGFHDVNSYSDLTKYNLPLTDNGEIYFNLKN